MNWEGGGDTSECKSRVWSVGQGEGGGWFLNIIPNLSI